MNKSICNKSVLHLHLKAEHSFMKHILRFCWCKSKHNSPVSSAGRWLHTFLTECGWH